MRFSTVTPLATNSIRKSNSDTPCDQDSELPKSSHLGSLLPRVIAAFALLLIAQLNLLSAVDAVPALLNYQSRIQVDEVPFNGSAQLKFALVNGSDTTVWTNDGSRIGSSGGTEPSSATPDVVVEAGLFHYLIGSQTPLTPDLFQDGSLSVRVWINTGDGFVALPERRLVSVGYAMSAGAVGVNGVNSAAIQDATVGVADLADEVTDRLLGENTVNSQSIANGSISKDDLSPALVTELSGDSNFIIGAQTPARQDWLYLPNQPIDAIVFGADQLVPTEGDGFNARLIYNDDLGVLRVGTPFPNSNVGPHPNGDDNTWGTDELGLYSFASGQGTTASGAWSFAANVYSTASGDASVAMNTSSRAAGKDSAAFNGSLASGDNSFAACGSAATGNYSFAVAPGSIISGNFAFAAGGEREPTLEGSRGSHEANGDYSAVFNIGNIADGTGSFAAGWQNLASSIYSAAFGTRNVAGGENAFASGNETEANGSNSFTSGNNTKTSGPNAFATGSNTRASGSGSFAIGDNTQATDFYSFAAGRDNSSTASYSFTAGQGNIASMNYEFLIGRFNNRRLTGPNRLFGVGYGTDANNRRSALEVFDNGLVRVFDLFESSDRRLKKDIQPLERVLPKLLNLRGVSFRWKNEEQRASIGFIAQEVAKEYPALVNETDKEGYLSVDYSAFTPLLLEATREQQQQIETQEATIAAQAKEIAKLRQQVQQHRQTIATIISRLDALDGASAPKKTKKSPVKKLSAINDADALAIGH